MTKTPARHPPTPTAFFYLFIFVFMIQSHG
jgi:hypothetical protein